MNSCPKCGYANDGDAMFCAQCGNLLTRPAGGQQTAGQSAGQFNGRPGQYSGAQQNGFSQSSKGNQPEAPQEGKPKKRGGLVAVLCLALVAAIGLGIGFWLTLSSPTARFLRAFRQTGDALGDYLSQPEQLADFGENIHTLLADRKEFTMELGISQELDFSLHCADGAALLQMEIPSGWSSLEMNFYGDSQVVQLEVPQFLDEVYGLPLENLGEELPDSALGQMLGLTEELDLSGESWTMPDYRPQLDQFLDTLTVEELGEETLTLGGRSTPCTVYSLSWDNAALAELINWFVDYGTLGATSMDAGTDASLPGANTAHIAAENLPQIEVEAYVDSRGNLVGLDITVEEHTLAIRLCGEENVWSELALWERDSSGDEDYIGGWSLEAGEDGILWTFNDSGGEAEFTIQYDNDSGQYSALDAYGGGITGALRGENGEAEFSLGDGYQEMVLIFSPLQEEPQPLSRDYVDLLEMTEADWQELIYSFYG